MAIQLEDLKKKQAADNEINWITASFMMLFHIGALVALFFFTWKAFFVSVVLWWISTSVGIGMCYHRLLTHRGYKTPKWVEYVMTVFATLALEGGPIFWVATHRIHHQYSDEEGDPHSPIDGKWWAHMGWILDRQIHAPRYDHALALRPRPRKRQISRLDHEISLRSDDRARPHPLRPRRYSVRSLGNFPPHRRRPAFHMAREFRHSFLGHAPFQNSRSFHQQSGGSLSSPGAKAGTTITTRIQFPRATALQLVRNRFQLVRHLAHEQARPRARHLPRKTLRAQVNDRPRSHRSQRASRHSPQPAPPQNSSPPKIQF